MKQGTVRHKNQAKVSIQIVEQEPFTGIVFLAIGDRLIDLLNDDRSFIPIKRDDGGMIIVAKSQIASIIEADATDDDVAPEESVADSEPTDDLADAQVEEDTAPDDESENKQSEKEAAPERAGRRFDPYATLRVSEDATIEEIRTAYKTRIKAVHPDSIAALGLDEDLARAALHTTQKVNYAYRKIMKERESMAEAEASKASGSDGDESMSETSEGDELKQAAG